MSMRSSIRAIAKARLKAMGVPHVNKVLCLGMCHTHAQNCSAPVRVARRSLRSRSSISRSGGV